MQRNVPPLGQCGIASLASFPNVLKAQPLPVPAPTTEKRPALPCSCWTGCTQTCKQMGMVCCDGTGGNCNCSPLSTCPHCGQPPPPDYGRCTPGCHPDGQNAGCVSTIGLPGDICAPVCRPGNKCPPVPKAPGVTAVPLCDYCFGANSSTDHPTACALICDASTTAPPFQNDGCPGDATCKPLCYQSPGCVASDPCEAAHIDLPCAKKGKPEDGGTCGFCTYPKIP